MHVLMTTDTVGGVWVYTQELVSQLLRHGVRVTLVSLGEIPSPEQTEWMEGLAGLDFLPTGFALEWMHDAQPDLEASQEYLENLIEEVQPDLLHFNQYHYGAISASQPRVVVAHSDVIGWWQAVHGHEPPATRWLEWYRGMIRRGLASASAVVAPSRWMLQSLKNDYGYGGGEVIFNGRTPSRFNPHISKEAFALSVGRIWDSGKQATLLLSDDLPLDCVVVGSERHPDARLRPLETQPAPGQLGRVRFAGEQSQAQLRQLYGRASIYVATSRYEPFGLAPVEAALSRCAIVANDIPTFREIWGDAACYFERNERQSLMVTLAALQSDDTLRRELANRAYHHALAHFTAERMAANYLKLYAELIPAAALAA